MGIKNVYDVAARAMSAQLVRMNAIASNLANANNVTGDKETAYKPLRPVFKTIYSDKLKSNGLSTVDAIDVQKLDREPIKTYQPNHPAADEEGYIYKAAVDMDEEMVEMLETQRQYTNNIEVLNTIRNLTMRTLNIGK
tara:strand:- start:695 stop:1108 length:414 start_codon:yes stop_codon:yes gene_type:complete